MNRRTFVKALPAVTLLAGSVAGLAQDSASAPKPLQPVKLPKPETDGGKSVLAVLQVRKTVRNIREDALPPQVLSNLLWAAWGVNREKGNFGKPGRTAASASNSQEIDLYVALAEGIYLYEAVLHQLTPVVAGDFRALAGRRGAATGPVNLFLVADLARYDQGSNQPDRSIGDPEVQKGYYCVATGLIAANISIAGETDTFSDRIRDVRAYRRALIPDPAIGYRSGGGASGRRRVRAECAPWRFPRGRFGCPRRLPRRTACHPGSATSFR
jgi:hypothetical protein